VLISHYLIYAIRFAKDLYNVEDIALFSKVALEHPNLPGLGPISGISDFITAHVEGELPLREFGTTVAGTMPKILVIETKRGDTLAELSSQTQLVAQLITLDYDDYRNM
jgi:hypothetical protein